MENHSKSIQDVEKKLKEAIDGTVGKSLKDAQVWKAHFLRAVDQSQEL